MNVVWEAETFDNSQAFDRELCLAGGSFAGWHGEKSEWLQWTGVSGQDTMAKMVQ
mgnify:CR=1 FL=1|jgi:hypothetical protein